jgi:hypothetical protein
VRIDIYKRLYFFYMWRMSGSIPKRWVLLAVCIFTYVCDKIFPATGLLFFWVGMGLIFLSSFTGYLLSLKVKCPECQNQFFPRMDAVIDLKCCSCGHEPKETFKEIQL